MPQKPESRPARPKGPAPRRIRMPKPKMLNWRTYDLTKVDTGGNDTLMAELGTYQKNLDLLLERKGEYVLIKGVEILGYYPDLESGLDAAAERFGREPALVKKIVQFEPFHHGGGLIL
jgi:hypothetical protein